MILRCLSDAYDRFAAQGGANIAPYGYSLVPVRFALVINKGGTITHLLDLRQDGADMEMEVPAHPKRSGTTPKPYFLCDKPSYALGIVNEGDRASFESFRDAQLEIIMDCNTDECLAYKTFLTSWVASDWRTNAILTDYEKDLISAKNVVFMYLETAEYLHDNPSMRKLWDASFNRSGDGSIGQCLITGSQHPIARIHTTPIKGVHGAQSSGASLVSFNMASFLSYGKDQSFNAPVSEDAAFRYATALNHMLASPRHRMRIGNLTTVFWAEKAGPEENLLMELFSPTGQQESGESIQQMDGQTRDQLRALFDRLGKGLPVSPSMLELNPRVTCYVLGLSPNNSRLSVRFWYTTSFDELFRNLITHYSDMSVVGLRDIGIPNWRILKESAVLGKTDNIHPLLSGNLIRAIVTGNRYPYQLYAALLARSRSSGETNGVSPVRTAVLKACLLRNARLNKNREKEGSYTVALNQQLLEPAYLCGRLFALLEKAQQDAIPNANSTIRDRYFGTASSAPATVFPQLLRLSRHHISKAEYGDLIDRRIQEVMNGLVKFPAHLNYEQQGDFILGYYHQRQALYTKRNKEEEECLK